MAFGKKKASALKKTESSKPSKKVPSSILQNHRDTEIYCDGEAAELLENVRPIEYKKVKIFFEKNLPKKKRIVFISPHPDDSAIACGATLSMLSKNNKVFIFIMTTGCHAEQNNKTKQQKIALREKESTEESKVLKTKPIFLRLGFYEKGEKEFAKDKQKIKKKLQSTKPDIIFLPQKKDNHPRHPLSRKLVLEVLAKMKKQPEIWEYETHWTLFSNKKFNSVVEFSEKELDQKITAIRKHASQIKRTKFDIAAKSISRFRAIISVEQCLSDFGEKPPKITNFVELFNIKKKQ